MRLVKAAASHNMNVHVHTIGDAASKAWVDGIAEAYPTSAFRDADAVVVSHSDFPVSPSFSAPWTVVMGTQRWMPSFGEECLRNADQALSRLDTLKAITTNVAWSWHAEDRMGSLEVGKLANMAVFDKDFLADDLAEVERAQCLATFVDGELAYEA